MSPDPCHCWPAVVPHPRSPEGLQRAGARRGAWRRRNPPSSGRKDLGGSLVQWCRAVSEGSGAAQPAGVPERSRWRRMRTWKRWRWRLWPWRRLCEGEGRTGGSEGDDGYGDENDDGEDDGDDGDEGDGDGGMKGWRRRALKSPLQEHFLYNRLYSSF